MTTDPHQDRHARADAMRTQLARIGAIHSTKVDEVSVSSSHRHPGSSQSGHIVLGSNMLPDPASKDAIATWIGVLMHEVGHCEWSPSYIEGANHHTYNIAEDARQELLLVDKYPGTVGPLTRAVADLILANSTVAFHPASVWPLLAGRTYLPGDLRQTVYDITVVFMGQEWTDDVRRVIGEYCQLIDPGYSQVDEAVLILAELDKLLGQMPEPPVNICNSQGGDTPAIERAEPAPDPIDQPKGDGEGEGEGGEKSPGGEGEGEGEGGEAGADGDGEGEGEEGEGEGESDEPGGGVGSGVSGPKVDDASLARQKVRKEAQKLSKEAAESFDSLTSLVQSKVKADVFGARDMSNARTMPVLSESRLAARQLSDHLKPLLDAAEAGLDRLTPNGRIRPDRISRGYRPDHVFDKWRIDQSESVAAEIVVAVDVSGSMHNKLDDLAQATWVLRTVAAKTAANLTIIAWDHTAEVVTSPLRHDEVYQFRSGGSTDGTPMLQLAEAIFDRSTLDRKWLVVMTDGSVGDPGPVSVMVKQLAKKRVMITPLGFGTGANAKVFGANARNIKSLLEIPMVVGGMLSDVYRQNVTIY